MYLKMVNAMIKNVSDLPSGYTKQIYITNNVTSATAGFGITADQCGKIIMRFSCTDTSRDDVFWGASGKWVGYVNSDYINSNMSISASPNISYLQKGNGNVWELTFTCASTETGELKIGWGTSGFKTSKNWYKIEMYDRSNNKVRDLIPCIEDATSHKGFYDMASGAFYDCNSLFS